MKKVLLGLVLVLGTLVSNAQDYKLQVTIGGISGITFGGSLNANYGGWVDFGIGGIQYLSGAVVSNENPSNYINGKSNSYTAGSTYHNIGVFYNANKFDELKYNLIMGGGVQSYTDITTDGLKTGYYPLVIVGTSFDLGYSKQYTLKLDASISKITSLNVGIGIKL